MAVKRNTPEEGQIYRHFKGSLYRIVTVAVHTEMSEKLVVYQSVEKPERVFARPLDMFMSEVDRLRYPLVRAKYRFTLLVEETEDTDAKEEKPVSVETDDQNEGTVSTEIKESSETLEEKKQGSEDIEKVSDTESESVTEEEHTECNSDDTAVYKEDGELVLDPYVEAVLDEKEFSKKIENFEMLRGKCTDDMLLNIAISLDVQLEEGSVEEKYAQILKTLRMHEKYESARLRG